MSMKYRDLRDFVAGLEAAGELLRVPEPVSPRLEMTAISDVVLRAGGPALLFEHPDRLQNSGPDQPVRHPERVALGMGAAALGELRDIGACSPA